ncbi:MAG: hypothetical protein IJX80_11075 [Clostridia bacterium]|nr:hypothetical protein [Clostridia bacterium]
MKRIVCVLLLLSAVLLYAGCAALQEVPTYTATATIRWEENMGDAVIGTDEMQCIYPIDDHERLITSFSVLSRVIEREALLYSETELKSMLRIHREKDDLFFISATASTGKVAAQIANAVATIFCDLVNAMYDDGKAGVKIWDEATVSTVPDINIQA